MMGNRNAEYKLVRSLARGLQVLEALNSRGAGEWRLTELAAHVGLHRTTLKRTLETLCKEGYLCRDAGGGRYLPTARVQRLGAGLRDSDALVLAARDLLPELTRRVVWPLALSTLDGDAMIVRAESHDVSPLAFHRTAIGYRFSLLRTSMGRAYLAACVPEQRQEMARIIGTAEAGVVSSVDAIEREILAHVVDGFGCNDLGWPPFSDFSAVSAPVWVRDQVVGCLTIAFPTRILTSALAVGEFGVRLKEGAAAIAVQAMNRKNLP
jgi:IclR family transcriptional regulator, mhp operon transcriptional activator